MSLDFTTWPKAKRKQKLYHSGIDDDDQEHLEGLGWELVDVRALPNDEDHQRGEAVKAWLEGVRLGSIQPTSQVAKFVELEARIYGLTVNKQAPKKREKVAKKTVDGLLDFGSKKGTDDVSCTK